MKISVIHSILLLISFGLSFLQASDNRRLSMGGIRISLPDRYNQLNLWQTAGNPAGLLESDSLNWMFYSADHLRRNNEIRRLWDAGELRYTDLVFSGQKRLDKKQMFYGYFRYGWENRFDMRYSIDRRPYELDPFVLTDSTEGTFNYYGPEIYTAYNYRFNNRFSLGAGLRYAIQQGLKTIFTRPEIIHRRLVVTAGAMYRLNSLFTLGFSFSYHNRQDLTKLVTQPDKTNPITYRYRGEYMFKKIIGKDDRVAYYDTYVFTPQLQWHNARWEGVLTAGYLYRWHELYDNPTQRIYDGFYQEQRFFARLVNRYYFNSGQRTLLAVDMRFGYIENWAREPKAGYLFYKAFYHRYNLTVGLSHRFSGSPFTFAAEYMFGHDLPDRRDHLAHVYRTGPIDQSELRTGLEYIIRNIFRIRAGLYYNWYQEDPVWQYFGNMNGPGITAGAGFYSEIREIDFYVKYGKSWPESSAGPDAANSAFDFVLNWRQFF